jgi:hypothetical protein
MNTTEENGITTIRNENGDIIGQQNSGASTPTATEADCSSEVGGPQSMPLHSDPCQLEGGQPEREYESPQVGLPHSDVRESEDERKNRLSDQHIADAKSRLCPDK